ncbi:MAG: S41 family peptidase [Pseudomonadota bacterium]|nr:S41 family peptidase [Pseudomonadota bacterium]
MGFRPSSYWRPIWQRSLLISLLAVSPVALSSEEPGQAEDEDVSAADTTQQQEQGLLPINELRTFADVFDRIKQAYVEEVDDKTLLENAIQGMLTELDPHSAYLKPEAYQDLQINTTGEFGGLGIEVGMEDGFVKVITPIDDTPAKKAGVEAGDLIIKLDSTPVKGLSLGEAVKLMRGKPGSDIVLTIIRAGIDKPLEITVTRAVIQVQSVRGRLLQKDYGYVRLSQFQINTGADMLKLLEKLRKENDADLKGLVLDLRNNPGGVLQAAVDVSDAFIDDGLVVYTQGRLPDSDMKFRAAPGDELKGVPIVVLVNGGSASASEIVAGALQDHSRAVIMGTTTFGKGSVQTVLPLHNNRALKLTTARYYTPGGRSIQAQGIEPDIVVENARLTRVEEMQRVKERDLSGHLENPEGEGETGAASDGKQALSDTDYQLYEALNLLKALNVIKRPATASAHQDNKRI